MEFIKIPNEYLESENGEKGLLTPNELSVYFCVVSFYDKYRRKTITNLSFLNEENPHFGNNKRGLTKMKDTLTSLKEKGIIHFDQLPNNVNQRIDITFEEPETSYERIPFDYFIKTKSSTDFMLLCVVRRWFTYKGKCEKTFVQWGNILHCDQRTVQNRVKKLEKDGLLRVKHGKYQNKKRQKINTYYPYDVEVKEKQKREKPKQHEENNIDLPEQTGNWFNGGKIEKDDIFLYFKHRDQYPKFKRRCELVIERLEKTAFKDSLHKMMQEVEKTIKRREEEINRLGENADHAFPTVIQFKKRKEEDLSFLDDYHQDTVLDFFKEA